MGVYNWKLESWEMIVNCHIVPQVYLRSWKIPLFKHSIYLFDKSDFTRAGVQSNIKKLKNTHFTAEDKYLLKPENKAYVFELYPEFSQLFDNLKGYEISYGDIHITTVDDLETRIIILSIQNK